MIQRREGLGLALKAGDAFRIICERRRENFDGDLSAELQVFCAIDLPHPAGAERGDDFIGAEAGAEGEAHSGRGQYQGQEVTSARSADLEGCEEGLSRPLSGAPQKTGTYRPE